VLKLLKETYNTTQLISDALGKINALVQFYEDTLKSNSQTPSSIADTQLTNFSSYTSKVNSHLSALLTDQNTLVVDPIDIQSSELSVTNAQNALQDAKDNLANYYIRAPFDGKIGTVSVNKYDQTSGAIATLITNDQYADMSVNEVDASKISIGDKATITFSAIPNLTLTGTVSERNPVGTVTQGVVNYDVRITLDAQNDQINPGMTLTAKIITATAQNTLVVPSSAVKTQGGQSYVLAFNPPIAESNASSTSSSANATIITTLIPERVMVTVGISDSSNTQILSGLSLGDQIILRTTTTGTVTPTAASSATTRGGFGGGGGAGAGGILRAL
jgi:HlyD family secretion protein